MASGLAHPRVHSLGHAHEWPSRVSLVDPALGFPFRSLKGSPLVPSPPSSRLSRTVLTWSAEGLADQRAEIAELAVLGAGPKKIPLGERVGPGVPVKVKDRVVGGAETRVPQGLGLVWG